MSSSPLGKKVSQHASIAARAVRTSGSPTTSFRMFGSKEIVPPLLFTNSAALIVISMMDAEKSDGPDTCKWPHTASISDAASVKRTWPHALFLMLNAKSRPPSSR